MILPVLWMAIIWITWLGNKEVAADVRQRILCGIAMCQDVSLTETVQERKGRFQ